MALLTAVALFPKTTDCCLATVLLPIAIASEPFCVWAVLPMAIELLPTLLADTPMAIDSFWLLCALLPIAIAPSAPTRSLYAPAPMAIPSGLLALELLPIATDVAESALELEPQATAVPCPCPAVLTA
nr:hypothetical protein [Neisseria polysaccharea]